MADSRSRTRAGRTNGAKALPKADPKSGPTHVSEPAEGANGGEGKRSLAALSVAALGVVYGDIGTSPLYAFKQSFHGIYQVSPDAENVLGVLSLIVWALIIVVSVKYLLFVLRADNRGEGGIIALVALLNPWNAARWSTRRILMLMGLFGACLLFADGTITPAISVLSAVEGLKVESRAFDEWVIPITVTILLGLFAVQKHGTSKIGALFGPVMGIWFVTLGVLGLGGILMHPGVLAALDPLHGLLFLIGNGEIGFIILGTVFLAVTGAEALYADMGHFGRAPIRLAWFALALPCLLLNYFGQGAIVLDNLANLGHPFFGLAPSWAHYPLVVLATLATIIASQAVISGVFSLTRQAAQLGQLPRVRVIQTDREHKGQIYIPFVNWMLMVATIGLVLGFRSSGNLAAAYGLAVSADMVITTCLAYFVARRFGWPRAVAAGLAAFFMVVDIAFLGANMFKFVDGGWFPVLVAGTVFGVMGIWRGGTAAVSRALRQDREPMDDFLERIAESPPLRISGTAIYLTSYTKSPPSALLHTLTLAPVLHERNIFVTVVIEDVPRVHSGDRVEVEELAPGFFRVMVHYGFMQSPNIPVALRFCSVLGLDIDIDSSTFYLGHETISPAADKPFLQSLATRFFAFMRRNTTPVSASYNLPVDRILATGRQLKI